MKTDQICVSASVIKRERVFGRQRSTTYSGVRRYGVANFHGQLINVLRVPAVVQRHAVAGVYRNHTASQGEEASHQHELQPVHANLHFQTTS